MDDYTCWNKHGEESVNDRDEAQAAGQHDGEDGLHETDTGGEEAPFGNQELCDDDVIDIAASFDEVHLAENLEEMVNVAFSFDEYTGLELKKLEQLLKDMKTPLYPTCKSYTKLSASLKLLQLNVSNHWIDKGFKQLLEVLGDMFPEGNEIPKTTYEAKKIKCPMGLKFEKIDACKNDCILFHGDNKEATEYSKCQPSRYKQRIDEGASDVEMRRKVPRKVVWYFPIIPRLKRLFATSKDARLLTWHSYGRKVDDYIRHPADGIQWRYIDSQYKSFSNEPRNLRFALSTDGMNAFGKMSSSHSVWPVLLSIYNLPPWLCNKQKYMMMSILIPGPYELGINIDEFLRLLIDDFKKNWKEEGIRVYDGFRKESFNLCAMLFTTITDIPGHRSVSR